MTSSATQGFLSDVLGRGRIPDGKLSYFQTRLATNVHQVMLKAFAQLEEHGNFTRRELAQRIGRKPEQITRWFAYPGNLTLATMSDIFVGMGYELESITLLNLETGRRIQCPEQPGNWMELLRVVQQEESSCISPPPESKQLSALSRQNMRQPSTLESLSFDKPREHSALRGLNPISTVSNAALRSQLVSDARHGT
jgi:hypothetical protein